MKNLVVWWFTRYTPLHWNIKHYVVDTDLSHNREICSICLLYSKILKYVQNSILIFVKVLSKQASINFFICSRRPVPVKQFFAYLFLETLSQIQLQNLTVSLVSNLARQTVNFADRQFCFTIFFFYFLAFVNWNKAFAVQTEKYM